MGYSSRTCSPPRRKRAPHDAKRAAPSPIASGRRDRFLQTLSGASRKCEEKAARAAWRKNCAAADFPSLPVSSKRHHKMRRHWRLAVLRIFTISPKEVRLLCRASLQIQRQQPNMRRSICAPRIEWPSTHEVILRRAPETARYVSSDFRYSAGVMPTHFLNVLIKNDTLI